MSYNVKLNQIAFVKYSEEPVFVIKITKNDEGQEIAIVRRAVTTDAGTKYEQDTFLLDELETEKSKVINHLELQKFQAEQRDKFAREYEEQRKLRNAAAAMHAPAVSDPTGYAN